MKKLSRGNELLLLKNETNFIPKTLELIRNAEHFILFHTYIFEDDEVTQIVLDEFRQASERGVKVYFLLDAWGSADFSLRAQNDLIEAGVNFKFFSPGFFIFKLRRRNHQKILICDNKHCIIGGINYARRFNLPRKAKPWLDYSCLISGEEVFNVFHKVLRIYLKHFKNKQDELYSFRNFSYYEDNNILVTTNVNDWVMYRQEIYKSYLKAIRVAKNEIAIMATYFIPSKKLLRQLKKARKRGVKIKLIFGSFSDHPIANLASDYFYQWYLDNDIEVYEWQDSIIHGKIALIDNKWTTIGSYNHNYLSQYGNLEINLEIINTEFAKVIKDEFNQLIAESKQITKSNISHKIHSKTAVTLVYILTNIIIFISLIILYQREKEK